MMFNIIVAAAIVLCATASPLWAHHGWSGYDSSHVLNLTGVIHESGYEHPHAFITLAAPGKTWVVVLAPPSRMERRGIARDMLTAGTTATVVGYPNRSDPLEMRAERITIDGETVELR
jgi:Family of unknown function (DUF6152)